MSINVNLGTPFLSTPAGQRVYDDRSGKNAKSTAAAVIRVPVLGADIEIACTVYATVDGDTGMGSFNVSLPLKANGPLSMGPAMSDRLRTHAQAAWDNWSQKQHAADRAARILESAYQPAAEKPAKGPKAAAAASFRIALPAAVEADKPEAEAGPQGDGPDGADDGA